MDISFFRMHPYRLVQWIVLWYCIVHLIIVILLKAADYIGRRIRAARKTRGRPAGISPAAGGRRTGL